MRVGRQTMQSAGPQLQGEAAPHMRRAVSLAALLIPQAGKVARQAWRSSWGSAKHWASSPPPSHAGAAPCGFRLGSRRPSGTLPLPARDPLPGAHCCPTSPPSCPTAATMVLRAGPRPVAASSCVSSDPCGSPQGSGRAAGRADPTGRPQPCARPPPPHPSLPRTCLAPLSLCKWG